MFLNKNHSPEHINLEFLAFRERLTEEEIIEASIDIYDTLKIIVHHELYPKHIIWERGKKTYIIDHRYSEKSNIEKNVISESLLKAKQKYFWYMAPETREKNIENSISNIYTFGLIIYELFSGGIPMLNCYSAKLNQETKSNVIKLNIKKLELENTYNKRGKEWSKIIFNCLEIYEKRIEFQQSIQKELLKLLEEIKTTKVVTPAVNFELMREFRDRRRFYTFKMGFLYHRIIKLMEKSGEENIIFPLVKYLFEAYKKTETIEKSISNIIKKAENIEEEESFLNYPEENKYFLELKKLINTYAQNEKLKNDYPELSTDDACTEENFKEFLLKNKIEIRVHGLYTIVTEAAQIMFPYEAFESLCKHYSAKLSEFIVWLRKSKELNSDIENYKMWKWK